MDTGRSDHGIIQADVTVKAWLGGLPSVGAVRPACCLKCGAPSRQPGRNLTIYGHGVVKRQQWGPPSPDGSPTIFAIVLRRYACQLCGAVFRVGPRGLVEHHRYSGAAIAMALCLWLVHGLLQAEVRSCVGIGFVPSSDADAERRWRSLPRWQAKAPSLWPELGGTAEAIIRALAAMVPEHGLGVPLFELAFGGAAHRRRSGSVM